MTDEPPALTLESAASKILLRLWRGERYVHHASPVASPADTVTRYAEIAATVAAHLTLRLGRRVHIVAGPGYGHLVAVYRALTTAMPTTSVDVPFDLPSFELPFDKRRPSPDRTALINVSTPPESPTIDTDVLVVVVPAGGIDARHFARYLTSGSQLLICGRDGWANGLHLEDVAAAEVPTDVLIAGGEFS